MDNVTHIALQGVVWSWDDPMFQDGGDRITKLCPITDLQATVERWSKLGREIKGAQPVSRLDLVYSNLVQ